MLLVALFLSWHNDMGKVAINANVAISKGGSFKYYILHSFLLFLVW